MARRGLVLKFLTALKQICNHPATYRGQPGPLPGRSGRLDAVAELLQIVRAEGDAALLDRELVAGAAATGVDLLPRTGELQPRCSCPDWAARRAPPRPEPGRVAVWPADDPDDLVPG